MGIALRLEKRPDFTETRPFTQDCPGSSETGTGTRVAVPVLDARLEIAAQLVTDQGEPSESSLDQCDTLSRSDLQPPASPTGPHTARLVRKREQPFLFTSVECGCEQPPPSLDRGSATLPLQHASASRSQPFPNPHPRLSSLRRPSGWEFSLLVFRWHPHRDKLHTSFCKEPRRPR